MAARWIPGAGLAVSAMLHVPEPSGTRWRFAADRIHQTHQLCCFTASQTHSAVHIFLCACVRVCVRNKHTHTFKHPYLSWELVWFLQREHFPLHRRRPLFSVSLATTGSRLSCGNWISGAGDKRGLEPLLDIASLQSCRQCDFANFGHIFQNKLNSWKKITIWSFFFRIFRLFFQLCVVLLGSSCSEVSLPPNKKGHWCSLN